jgi:hypothetical protein
VCEEADNKEGDVDAANAGRYLMRKMCERDRKRRKQKV